MQIYKLPACLLARVSIGTRSKWTLGPVGLLTASLIGATALAGNPVITQSISLQAGWNSVFLSVEPSISDPQTLFTNLPVDKVATYFPSRTPVEFIQDPASTPWKQIGWSVWYAPSLPEGPISDLSGISGGQGYLVHSLAATTLSVTGRPSFRRTRWKADSYNFTGFPVDPNNPPTFATWFAGSLAHRSSKRSTIFTLNSAAQWTAVDHPELTRIVPGTAYWVFCQGASDYQGPVDISIPFGGQGTEANFGDTNTKLILRLAKNLTVPTRATFSLEQANGISLFYQQRSDSDGTVQTLPFTTAVTIDLPDFGQRNDVGLILDRATLGGAGGAAILTVRDEIGTLVQIPVSGKQP